MRAATRLILFDFDGVIVDSVPLKTDAFVALYPGASPAQRDYIRDYQIRHGGVSRVHKIAHYEEMLHGAAPGPAFLAQRTAEYARLVEDAVVACADIRGAPEFLRDHAETLKLFLVSGTPTEELQRIVGRRGIAAKFRAIVGSPPDKQTSFSRILEAADVSPDQALAVGDSLTEFEAAVALGIPFVGVVSASAANPFPSSVPVVGDLTTLDAYIRNQE